MKTAIKIKSFKGLSFNKTLKEIERTASILNLELDHTFGKTRLPVRKKKITVMRSPHIDKNSREQFEWQHHKTVFLLKNKKASAKVVPRVSCSNKETFYNKTSLKEMNSDKNFSFFIFYIKHCIFPGVEISLSVNFETYC